MNTSTSRSQKIEAREVPDHERLDVLPRRFRRHMLTVENAIYDFMAEHARAYRGGFWKFVELSNGGFYMAPVGEVTFDVHVEGNGFEGAMSADAAGITACLFAFSHAMACNFRVTFVAPFDKNARTFEPMKIGIWPLIAAQSVATRCRGV